MFIIYVNIIPVAINILMKSLYRIIFLMKTQLWVWFAAPSKPSTIRSSLITCKTINIWRMYSENILVMTQDHQKKLNLLFPRSCKTDEAEMLLQLHHADPIGEILRRLFAESLCTVNLYLPFLARGFYPLSKGWNLFQVYISGNSKLNEKLRSCLVWGFCQIISTGDSHWWGFVSIVPKCIQAKLLFALVEISRPPNRSKLHKCKWQLAALCWLMSLPWGGGGGVGLDDL